MEKYLLKFKKLVAVSVLSMMAVCAAAQTAEAAGAFDAVGLANSRSYSGYRKSQGSEYWSYTRGYEYDEKGYGCTVTVYAKMSTQAKYTPRSGVGEASVDSLPKETAKGDANHKFESSSGFKAVWTSN